LLERGDAFAEQIERMRQAARLDAARRLYGFGDVLFGRRMP
jgi:hypothetical protein